ncbi:MFS transporter [Campylobacter canadensis]|uniref:MFS transporter n=1 Tax=Campylobacter canadensis TaxID=449520 RepID=A0ABS7WRD8_9BACT|nr:MFS transporter [Campylobacter canadensis]MBZ7986946.1 MFS transporter [Campylobacter canadensis]MBZ7994265.1 MFS transporter [Campylobacter canadensis]MBZ7995743.1 MFS transporter [Campylobacter canadensis]MBZ7997982.1 MFS transporter [Campylobacter canadensis]MBZ7999597.1 MFS transporter [Campylobacter canadensis]
MFKSYAKLIKNNKNYAILVLVQFITYFGAWFSQVGVYTMLIGFDFSLVDWGDFSSKSVKNWAISASVMCAFLPPILLAPFSGILIDNFNSKKLMMTMVIVELISVFLLLFIKDASYIYFLFFLIFVRITVASIYFQTEMSVIPHIFSKEELKLANELFSIIWAVSYTTGMAAAGVFCHYFGIKAAFILDCILFCIALYLLFFLKLNKETKKLSFKKAYIMLLQGIAYIKLNKKIIHLMLLHGVIGATTYDAIINYLASYEYLNKVYFLKQTLSVALLIGLSNTFRACSLVIGPLILSKIANKNSLFYLYLAQGFGIIIWAIFQFSFYLSLVGMLVAGFCTSTIWSYTYTQIQNSCDKKYYGRVIAYVDMVYVAFSLLLTILVGYLFNNLAISLANISIFMGSIFIFAAFYWLYFTRKYL